MKTRTALGVATPIFLSLLLASSSAHAQYGHHGDHGDIMQCRNALEGRVAWNPQNNDTHWSQDSVERLCRGGARDEPARCFERLMRGNVNWGGGTNWQFDNAVNLCHATEDHRATIACFEGQIRGKIAWQTAIANCARPPQMQQANYVPPSDPMAACRSAVEGRIPWNGSDTHWAPANVERLCQGGVRDEPARCFERLMQGRVSWGGGTNWQWENAVGLCHGSQDANATIACFEGQIRGRIAWQTAIQNCGSSGAQPTQPQMTQQPVDPIAPCREALQGRVAWNSNGDTRWAEANIDQLCRGGVRDEPARCFERLMRGGVNWGGGTKWEWENASELCHASQNAQATISCFEGQIRAKIAWKSAILACRR